MKYLEYEDPCTIWYINDLPFQEMLEVNIDNAYVMSPNTTKNLPNLSFGVETIVQDKNQLHYAGLQCLVTSTCFEKDSLVVQTNLNLDSLFLVRYRNSLLEDIDEYVYFGITSAGPIRLGLRGKLDIITKLGVGAISFTGGAFSETYTSPVFITKTVERMIVKLEELCNV